MDIINFDVQFVCVQSLLRFFAIIFHFREAVHIIHLYIQSLMLCWAMYIDYITLNLNLIKLLWFKNMLLIYTSCFDHCKWTFNNMNKNGIILPSGCYARSHIAVNRSPMTNLWHFIADCVNNAMCCYRKSAALNAAKMRAIYNTPTFALVM